VGNPKKNKFRVLEFCVCKWVVVIGNFFDKSGWLDESSCNNKTTQNPILWFCIYHQTIWIMERGKQLVGKTFKDIFYSVIGGHVPNCRV
jgi:hypothetical protein